MIHNPKITLDYYHWSEVKAAVNTEIRSGRIATFNEMKEFILNWSESPYFDQEKLNKAIIGTLTPDGDYTGGFHSRYRCVYALDGKNLKLASRAFRLECGAVDLEVCNFCYRIFT